MLSFTVKIILKSWSLNIEYGLGMYIKYFLSIGIDILFLVLLRFVLWEDEFVCLGFLGVEGGR